MDLDFCDLTLNGDQLQISDQVTGTRDNPTFSIVPPITDCVGLAMKSITVPFTYYVVDNTCNTFDLTYKSNVYTCRLTPGSYNDQNIGGEFIAAIRRTAAGALASDFRAYVDNTSNNFIIYTAGVSTDPTNAFQINFNVINSAASNLGFDQALYSSSNVGTFYDNSETPLTNYRISSPRIINLTGPGEMYLNSDLGGSVFGQIRNQTSAQGLLGKWDVNCNYTGTIEHKESNPSRLKISRCTISKINLKLLLGNRTAYDNGSGTGIKDYLQLNGESFSVTIRFFRLAATERVTTDALGNSTTTSIDMSKSSVYRPSTVTAQNVMGGRFKTVQQSYDAHRSLKRSKQ